MPRTSGPRRPAAPTRLVVALTCATAAALIAGCSAGQSDFNGNTPDGQPGQQDVVRTPSPLGTQVPGGEPDPIDTLPGPTGGLINNPPTTALPASPGQGSDGGVGPAN